MANLLLVGIEWFFLPNYTIQEIGELKRLNTNGSVDTSLNLGANGFLGGGVNSIVQQSDGKLVVGGTFTSYNTVGRNRIARLNTNGSIDSTFTIGTGFNGGVTDIIQQSDGKFVVGGTFTSYNGTTRSKIARLNTNGDL